MATMAMGVAAMPTMTNPRQSSTLVLRASATNTGEKKGFLDWFREALDKDALRETDAVLNKVDGNPSNGKAPAAGKKGAAAPAPKKGGFNLFGKK